MASDKMEINLKYVDACRRCKGTGAEGGEVCSICLGKKKVLVQNALKSSLPPCHDNRVLRPQRNFLAIQSQGGYSGIRARVPWFFLCSCCARDIQYSFHQPLTHFKTMTKTREKKTLVQV